MKSRDIVLIALISLGSQVFAGADRKSEDTQIQSPTGPDFSQLEQRTLADREKVWSDLLTSSTGDDFARGFAQFITRNGFKNWAENQRLLALRAGLTKSDGWTSDLSDDFGLGVYVLERIEGEVVHALMLRGFDLSELNLAASAKIGRTEWRLFFVSLVDQALSTAESAPSTPIKVELPQHLKPKPKAKVITTPKTESGPRRDSSTEDDPGIASWKWLVAGLGILLPLCFLWAAKRKKVE